MDFVISVIVLNFENQNLQIKHRYMPTVTTETHMELFPFITALILVFLPEVVRPLGLVRECTIGVNVLRSGRIPALVSDPQSEGCNGRKG